MGLINLLVFSIPPMTIKVAILSILAASQSLPVRQYGISNYRT